MPRKTAANTALLAATLAAAFSISLAQAGETPKSREKTAATQPDKLDGELFPDVPAGGTVKPKPKPDTPAPAPIAATRPAVKPQPPKVLPPTPRPVAVATQPATQSFTPTHRITLLSNRTIDGIPTAEGDKLTIKMEVGSISVDQTQVEKIEPLTQPAKQ